MVLNCWKIDYFEKNFWSGQRMTCTKNSLEHFNEIPPPGRGFICHAMSLHPLSMLNIARQKYVKNKYDYEDRYRPLKFQICIAMIGKCTCQMAYNCGKIDNFEKKMFWGIENYMYCKNICVSISMKCLAGGIIYHAMSLHPLSISSIWVLIVLIFLKCTF